MSFEMSFERRFQRVQRRLRAASRDDRIHLAFFFDLELCDWGSAAVEVSSEKMSNRYDNDTQRCRGHYIDEGARRQSGPWD